jgi:16S rRNA (guanine1207-N2)-methyltransferase
LAQYFDNVDLKSELRKIDVRIFDMNFSFYSDNGVFAKDKLDFGTRLMLENIDWDNVSGPILDVGCGYGPIGIIANKITGSVVTMCDVNKRAVHLTERNIKENGADCEVTISNCYDNIGGTYNTIITNPPIRAGKKIVYEILFKAKEHLKNNGCIYLVIHKDQGAKSLLKDLEKEYQVEVLEKEKGFFVIKCKKC